MNVRGSPAGEARFSGKGFTVARIIKKYPNRRLYDTETSAYITLADVKQFVLENQDFEVQDALDKLERLSLVGRTGEAYTARSAKEALDALDARWDGLFSYSGSPAT